jgi:23S rRNA (cytosine1962-C5)-methyltransferase
MEILELLPDRDRSVRRRHPWVYTGAISRRDGDAKDGLVEVRAPNGEVLGRGLADRQGPIGARLWTFGDAVFGPECVEERFDAARRLRERVRPPETTGLRLLHSEGDGAPGIVADRYGETDVLVLAAEGAVRRAPEIEAIYRRVFAPARLVLRAGGGKDETRAGVEHEPVPFLEHGLRFEADIRGGQKTGFFLDQRDNRAAVRRLAAGAAVLNLFSYSGGFSVAALAGGAARAVDVDSSAAALAAARRQRAANGQQAPEEDFVRADVFEDLRVRAAARERWDLVICDPPAFAKKKSDLDRACRGYKDIARLAMTLVAPGGILLACSCSGVVSAELFQKVLFAAGLDAGTEFSILERSGAGPDHPVSLDCPETEYLKAFFLERRPS